MVALLTLLLVACSPSPVETSSLLVGELAPVVGAGEPETTAGEPDEAREAVIAEREQVVAAARIARQVGRVPASDSRHLVEALEAAYGRMLSHGAGPLPRPLGETSWGRGAPASLEALVVGPDEASVAVVFLHGYGGLFGVQCWQMAQAAPPGAVTLCPDGGLRGDWWAPGHHRPVEAALALLEARGVETSFLAGLSNGARGAGALAPRFADRLAGVIVISGASTASPPPGLPVLAVQGTGDHMFSAAAARSYARRAGSVGTFVPIDSGHFAFLDHAEEVRGAIASWFRARR